MGRLRLAVEPDASGAPRSLCFGLDPGKEIFVVRLLALAAVSRLPSRQAHSLDIQSLELLLFQALVLAALAQRGNFVLELFNRLNVLAVELESPTWASSRTLVNDQHGRIAEILFLCV